MSILQSIFGGSKNMDKVFFETLIKKTINNPKYNLAHEYKEGKQWKTSGQITGTGISIIDKTSPLKTYHGVVVNLVEDAISSMTSFAMGEEEENYTAASTDNEKANEMLKGVNVNDLVEDIYETSLTYGKAYIQVGEMDKVYMNVLSPRELYCSGGDYYWVSRMEGTQDKYLIQAYKVGFPDESGNYDDSKIRVEFYENQKFLNMSELPYDVMPFWEIDLDQEFITPSLLKLQDYINIKHTKIFDIEKYNSDPLTVLKSEQPIGVDQRPRVGAGSLVNLGPNDSLERLSGEAIDPEFRASIEEMKLDFWKKAHLGALKNSDLSGVTSGYAIQLKLIDTFAFANTLRTRFKGELLEMFKYFYTVLDDERFLVGNIYLSPLQGERLKETEQKGMKIDNIKKEAELLNILIQGGMTRDEAQAYIDLKLL